MLEVRGITKTFGGVHALEGVDLTVKEGEIAGLIGANGAGKTTLFSVITGFHAPTAGKVIFKGKDITGKKPYDICKIGLVRTFQVVRPFPRMTVLKNTAVGKLYGTERLRDRERAGREAYDILELVGLAHKANAPAAGLTMADRKRLEVARALAAGPDLLLLDEVLAGLTPAETSEAMKLVRDINQRLGVTIFMVEHVMKAVIGLCDRVTALHFGCKLAEGTPREIARNPEVIEAYLGEQLEI